MSFAEATGPLINMVRNWPIVFSGLILTGCTTGRIGALESDGGAGGGDAAVTQGLDAGQLDAGAFDVGFDAGVAQVVDAGERPGIFVAMGNGARHLRSLDDGVTWVDDATTDGIGVRTVVWGNGQFVAFAEQIIASPDGNTWAMVPKGSGAWSTRVVAGSRQEATAISPRRPPT